jgi:hypothetical protein
MNNSNNSNDIYGDKFSISIIVLVLFCIFNTFPFYFILGLCVGIWSSTKFDFKPIIDHYNIDAGIKQALHYLWTLKEHIQMNAK